MKKALSIAGFDPSGGAGIQADLKVFRHFGIYGLSVVAALTAQNTFGVSSVLPVDRRFVKKQLSVLLSDIRPDAVKIGMLLSIDNAASVAGIIKKHALGNIVLDPVFISSSGKRLAEKEMSKALITRIFPLCTVITPNIYEASVLAGMKIRDADDMQKAAIRLRDLGPENVIITGGHLEKAATDIFYNGKFHYLKGRKTPGEYHGTGCTFSSAIAALLASGSNALHAAEQAKKFMNKVFKHSIESSGTMRLLRI